MRSIALVRADVIKEKRQLYIMGDDYFSDEMVYSQNVVSAIKTPENPNVRALLLDEEGVIFVVMR